MSFSSCSCSTLLAAAIPLPALDPFLVPTVVMANLGRDIHSGPKELAVDHMAEQVASETETEKEGRDKDRQ